MFFNLFGEAEPFAAVLIAHGTHVFWRGEFKAKGRDRGKGSGEGPVQNPWIPLVEPLGSVEARLKNTDLGGQLALPFFSLPPKIQQISF